MLERIIYYFQKRIFKASRLVGVFGAFLLLILILLTVIDVCMRRFFNAPVRGSLEVTQIILGVSVFTTLAFCAIIEGGHVEVDILVNRFPQKAQKGIVAIMYFLTAVFAGLMCWRLVLYAMRIYDVHEVSAILAISPFPFISIAALGTALLALVFLSHFLVNMTEVLKK